MKITASDLHGKKIGFFGIGESNLSLLRTLPLENSEVVLRSDASLKKDSTPSYLAGCKIYDGEKALTNITEDILFLSPSARRDRDELQAAKERGTVLSSDAELFYEHNTAPLYTVTGSDGKSTTATLISELFNKRMRTELIGNIGVPMFASINSRCKAYVAELSSFMLNYAVPKSRRACLTNITPNHLDWHTSEDEYVEAKLSLLRCADEAVLCYDENIMSRIGQKSIFALTSHNATFEELRRKYKAELYITYEKNGIHRNGARLIEESAIVRKELYNIKNLMNAIATTHGTVSDEDIADVAKSFAGLPHRCEHVGRFRGIDFYDSSIDSTPSRTRETLKSLKNPCVIILGGRSKGVSYLGLLDGIDQVRYAVICGENSEEIHHAIRGKVKSVTLDDFDSAVEFAAKLAEGCGTVLLSPASTSYDRFSSYRERGERFRQIAKNLQI